MSGTPAAPIHLDTSFLIRALVPGSAEAAALGVWITEGRPLAMSAVAWGELLCGPLEADHEALASAVIRTIVPLDAEAASLAASLFNAGGRRRGSFPDCLVAVTCVRAGAALATANPTSGASQARGRSWSTHRMSSGQGDFPNGRSAVGVLAPGHGLKRALPDQPGQYLAVDPVTGSLAAGERPPLRGERQRAGLLSVLTFSEGRWRPSGE